MLLALAGACLSGSGCNVFDAIFGKATTHSDSRLVWRINGRTNKGVPWYDDSAAYFLGLEHTLTAVHKRTGGIRWAITLPVTTRETTLGFGGFAAGDRVVVGDDQEIFALSTADASILWRFTSPDIRDIGRNRLLPGTGVAYTGSANGYVLAIDLVTGQERWQTRLSSNGSVVVWLGAVVDGTLYVSFTDFDFVIGGERIPQGAVAALDAATGTMKWHQWLPHNVDSLSPTATIEAVVAGSVVIAGARDGPVYALDRSTGAVRWKAPAIPTPGITDPATIRDIRSLCSNSRLTYIGSDAASVVVAADLDTGHEAWRISTPLGSPSWMSCDERYVLVFYPGGQLGTYDAASGAHRWTLDLSQDRNTHYFVGGAIDGDRLYAGGIYNINALRLH